MATAVNRYRNMSSGEDELFCAVATNAGPPPSFGFATRWNLGSGSPGPMYDAQSSRRSSASLLETLELEENQVDPCDATPTLA
jgi:hypothetical protein